MASVLRLCSKLSQMTALAQLRLGSTTSWLYWLRSQRVLLGSNFWPFRVVLLMVGRWSLSEVGMTVFGCEVEGAVGLSLARR